MYSYTEINDLSEFLKAVFEKRHTMYTGPILLYKIDAGKTSDSFVYERRHFENTKGSLDLQLYLALGLPKSRILNSLQEYLELGIVLPTITFNVKGNPELIVETVTLQYLTCDGGYVDKQISFRGFISAFDLTTWILFLCVLVYLVLMHATSIRGISF